MQRSEAVRYAAGYLQELGIPVTEKCAPDVTHVLLPVPSFSGGDEYLAHLLTKLPDNVIVSGGNLNSPLLEGYCAVDFLQDPYYLADNAAITADCALQIVENRTGTELAGKKALILGWGRIGKCLGQRLRDRNANVTIAARKTADLAMIHGLGYGTLAISDTAGETARFDIILNTVPELLLPNMAAKTDAVILELASKPGMTGDGIINARGLPGKMAPERSGRLIADTFIRLSL